MDLKELIDLMKILGQPMANVYMRELRKAYEAYSPERELGVLIEIVREIQARVVEIEAVGDDSAPAVRREDLHLVCFDYVWS